MQVWAGHVPRPPLCLPVHAGTHRHPGLSRWIRGSRLPPWHCTKYSMLSKVPVVIIILPRAPVVQGGWRSPLPQPARVGSFPNFFFSSSALFSKLPEPAPRPAPNRAEAPGAARRPPLRAPHRRSPPPRPPFPPSLPPRRPCTPTLDICRPARSGPGPGRAARAAQGRGGPPSASRRIAVACGGCRADSRRDPRRACARLGSCGARAGGKRGCEAAGDGGRKRVSRLPLGPGSRAGRRAAKVRFAMRLHAGHLVGLRVEWGGRGAGHALAQSAAAACCNPACSGCSCWCW